MTTYSQATTDLVEVTTRGEVTLVEFAWESRRETPSRRVPDAFYAHTDAVERVITAAAASGARIVDALADDDTLVRYQPLADGAADLLATTPFCVVVSRFGHDEWHGNVWAKPAQVGLDIDPARLVTFNRDDDTFTRFDGSPLPQAFLVDAGATLWDLAALAPILAAHPWVTELFYDTGRPYGYDHVPARLQMFLVPPVDVIAQARADRGHVSGHVLEELLFWPMAQRDLQGPFASDPLGIAAAARKDQYPYPGDDDYVAPDQRLAETLPKSSSIWYSFA